METIGQRIKKLRLEKGITQEDLGKKIGVQKSAIAKYEKEDNDDNIKRSKVLSLAEALGTTPQYLLGWETPANTSKFEEINNTQDAFEFVNKRFGSNAKFILEKYFEFNEEGQQHLIQVILDMIELKRFSRNDIHPYTREGILNDDSLHNFQKVMLLQANGYVLTKDEEEKLLND